MRLEVNMAEIEQIKAREITNRKAVPEYTLDWYIYDNRIRLIDEIINSFIEVVRVDQTDGSVIDTTPVDDRYSPTKDSNK